MIRPAAYSGARGALLPSVSYGLKGALADPAEAAPQCVQIDRNRNSARFSRRSSF